MNMAAPFTWRQFGCVEANCCVEAGQLGLSLHGDDEIRIEQWTKLCPWNGEGRRRAGVTGNRVLLEDDRDSFLVDLPVLWIRRNRRQCTADLSWIVFVESLTQVLIGGGIEHISPI